MSIDKAQNLITKFLTSGLSDGETRKLEGFLENPEYRKVFDEAVSANFLSDYNLKKFSQESLLEKLRQEQTSKRNPLWMKKFSTPLKYAAVLVILLTAGYFLGNYLMTPSSANQQVVVGDDAIILELENGETEVLNVAESKVVQNGSGIVVGTQDKNQMTYAENPKIENLVYNTLKVPYGKQFDLVLSDGTRVYLNAGTSLKYPIRFLPGLKREVFLTGEAFFDVEEDKKHPFVVNANDLDVTVLGTEFVVSLYEEDENTSVVLIEGSVDLTKEESSSDNLRLVPGTRGVLDNETGLLSKSFVKTGIYTAWMQGVLVFRNETFEEISKKLERIYNVSIISENPDFDKEVFNASFDNETIEDILSYFHDSYDMEYTIENNIIYIK